MNSYLTIVMIGIGATAFIDLWTLARKHLLGVPAANYALVGRWLAYIPRGQFIHRPISASKSIQGEGIIGWIAHYLIGIGFAAGLVLVWGDWLSTPTLMPAVITGVITVLAPFLIMQPGMGSGLAARKTPNPTMARIHSLVMHLMFGLGLYLSGLFIHFIS